MSRKLCQSIAGTGGVEAVEGSVLESGEQSVTLSIRSVKMRRGDDQFWRGE